MNRLSVFRLILVAISTASMATAYAFVGPSLGLFFAGFFVATWITPAAVFFTRRPVSATISAGLATAPIIIFWVIPIFRTPDTFIQWLQLSVTLISYFAAIGAIAWASSGHQHWQLGFSLSIIIGTAWLTWPIWLSPSLTLWHAERLVNVLVATNPSLVANGVLISEPPWTERTVAYQLTNLNQDIPIHSPTSALPCMIANLLFALAVFGLRKIALLVATYIGYDAKPAVSVS
jgi:hypothetical protein